jgi:hypothetical protein
VGVAWALADPSMEKKWFGTNLFVPRRLCDTVRLSCVYYL